MIAILLFLCTALAGPRMVPTSEVDLNETDQLFRGRRLALLVGPNGFEDQAFSPLAYTHLDATALSEVLRDPERGHFDQVWTLTNTLHLEDLRKTMAEVKSQVTSSDDTVLVYFSTHGTLARTDGELRQHLVLSDTKLIDVEYTALSHEELLAWLDSLHSRRKVLILATCHSGQGKSVLSPSLREEFSGVKGGLPLPPLRIVSEAIVLIGVCAFDETARESKELGHDIYTWFFMEALEKADLDGDLAVTVTEAHEYARQRTYEYTEGAQRPYARAEILGADPIVLTGHRNRAVAAASLGSYNPRVEGYQIKVDGEAKGVLPGLVSLDSGIHRVELLSPNGKRVVARRRLKVDKGGRVDVNTLLNRDRVRVGLGPSMQLLSAPGAGGPGVSFELHLPNLIGPSWDIVAHGSPVIRWPNPTLEGGIALERVVVPGVFQLRLGLGLEGYLLGAKTDPPLLAPSLVPVPVLSFAIMPDAPSFARLAISGGYLWYTDAGTWNNGWTARASLVVGVAF
ncbi:MAG: caspase family protein [Proteobacteria bacterium]|nr:caspase family protein [Pseudomonadota bacterium]